MSYHIPSVMPSLGKPSHWSLLAFQSVAIPYPGISQTPFPIDAVACHIAQSSKFRGLLSAHPFQP